MHPPRRAAEPCQLRTLPQLALALGEGSMGKSKHNKKARLSVPSSSNAQPSYAVQHVPMQMPMQMPMQYPMMQSMPYALPMQPVTMPVQTPLPAHVRTPRGRKRAAPGHAATTSGESGGQEKSSPGCSSSTSNESSESRQQKSGKKRKKTGKPEREPDCNSSDEEAPIGRTYKQLGGSTKVSYPRTQRSADSSLPPCTRHI